MADEGYVRMYERYEKKNERFHNEETELHKRGDDAINVFSVNVTLLMGLSGGGFGILRGTVSCFNGLLVTILLMVPFILGFFVALSLTFQKLKRINKLLNRLRDNLGKLQGQVTKLDTFIQVQRVQVVVGELDPQQAVALGNHFENQRTAFKNDVSLLTESINEHIAMSKFKHPYKSTLIWFIVSGIVHAIALPTLVYISCITKGDANALPPMPNIAQMANIFVRAT